MNFIDKISLLTGFGLIDLEKYQPLLGPHLMRLFQKLEINVVLDVGANDGGFARTLRRYGYKGHILSFEPLSEVFQNLKKAAFKDQCWHVFNIALGAEPEERELHVMGSSDFSSFLNPNGYAKSKWQNGVECVKTERVKVERLDHIIDNLLPLKMKDSRIFLKMDTQGYDLNVFYGALGVLDSLLGIQAELPFKAIYAGVPSYVEILSVFEKHGFKPTGFFPVSKDKEGLFIVEADCVFIKIN